MTPPMVPLTKSQRYELRKAHYRKQEPNDEGKKDAKARLTLTAKTDRTTPSKPKIMKSRTKKNGGAKGYTIEADSFVKEPIAIESLICGSPKTKRPKPQSSQPTTPHSQKQTAAHTTWEMGTGVKIRERYAMSDMVDGKIVGSNNWVWRDGSFG